MNETERLELQRKIEGLSKIGDGLNMQLEYARKTHETLSRTFNERLKELTEELSDMTDQRDWWKARRTAHRTPVIAELRQKNGGNI